jgi:uncharacterized membrane protein
MSSTQKAGSALIRISFTGLLVWQLCWHAIIPPPSGNGNWWVAIFAALPLLVLLPGVSSFRNNQLQWAIFATMLYFIFATMELWSNPAQRWVATVQLLMTLSFFTGFVLFNRRARSDR